MGEYKTVKQVENRFKAIEAQSLDMFSGQKDTILSKFRDQQY